jgi:hypothetical protein
MLHNTIPYKNIGRGPVHVADFNYMRAINQFSQYFGGVEQKRR